MQQTPISAILLDRDGVINVDSPDYILSPEQWQAIPGSLEAIAQLHQHGIPTALVSNQSAVGRRMMSLKTQQAIHQRMMSAIHAHGGDLNAVAYCTHHPDDACKCRKPSPGMIYQVLNALHIPQPSESIIMIGDSLRDVQAAINAGVRPVLVQSGYGDAQQIAQRSRAIYPNLLSFPDLKAAVQYLLFEEV